MAYRSSGGPYYKGTIDASTKTNLIDNLCDALVNNVSWTRVSGDGTTDQLLQSPATPQGSQFRMRFYDYGHANVVAINPRTVDGNRMITADGNGLGLYAGAGKTYTLVASPYQWACYTLGSTLAREWYYFSIPWLPSFYANKVRHYCFVWTNMFDQGNASIGNNFRSGYTRNTMNNGWIFNDATWYHFNNFVDFPGDTRLVIPTNAWMDAARAGRWIDGRAPISDPYVASGTSGSDPSGIIRGQLWDSYWYGESNLMTDEEVVIGGLNYKNMFGSTAQASTSDCRGCLLTRIP